jgi:hypothetical protein
MEFKVGDKVEIMEYGEWVGPFTVIATEGGRTKDHIILKGLHTPFELYNDAPYNIRKYNV